MDRIKIKQLAKNNIKGKILIIFALSLLVALVTGALTALPIAGIFVAIVIAGPLSLSWASIYLNVIRKNKSPIIEDLFTGFSSRNFLRGIVGMIYYEIFVLLWSLLFVIPGIIKSISYSQMFYLMIDDPKLEAGDAQKKSMALMRGHKLEYFLLQLSFFPWFLLIIITFGLAAIYVDPYIQASYAAFYDKLVGKKSTKKSAKKSTKKAKKTKK